MKKKNPNQTNVTVVLENEIAIFIFLCHFPPTSNDSLNAGIQNQHLISFCTACWDHFSLLP